MPEHFHGIIWVHERLRAPLGEVIRSFKIACTKANLALETPIAIDGSTTFWFPGLYDTILFGNGQLKKMTRYVLRNAERRWAVMQNPNLFKVTRSVNLSELINSTPASVSPAAPAGVSPAARTPCAQVISKPHQRYPIQNFKPYSHTFFHINELRLATCVRQRQLHHATADAIRTPPCVEKPMQEDRRRSFNYAKS